METKINKIQMERVRRSCGFANGIDVDSNGSRGGLCLAWRSNATITLQNFSKRHIDMIIEDSDDGKNGDIQAQDRDESWNLLKSLCSNEELPWIVCGDFNEIMYGFEKKGGLPRDERRMEAFQNVLED
ncbi:reverse transcriptase [Gossypium australe]|uniref:Reverse transcriptase n=1 Tax=Gossypium australe TaxID=47621 RepID=A0A5B6VIP9_9ROSI|nr:reverse transcriptase [Gossypium australe]